MTHEEKNNRILYQERTKDTVIESINIITGIKYLFINM